MLVFFLLFFVSMSLQMEGFFLGVDCDSEKPFVWFPAFRCINSGNKAFKMYNFTDSSKQTISVLTCSDDECTNCKIASSQKVNTCGKDLTGYPVKLSFTATLDKPADHHFEYTFYGEGCRDVTKATNITLIEESCSTGCAMALVGGYFCRDDKLVAICSSSCDGGGSPMYVCYRDSGTTSKLLACTNLFKK